MKDKKFDRPSQLNRYLMMDDGASATGWLKDMGAPDVLRKGYRKGFLAPESDPPAEQPAKIRPQVVLENDTRRHPMRRKSDEID